MRWKIFFYMCAFVGALLILLWLFQVVFLDEFYQGVKTKQIKSTVKDITEIIEDYGISDALDYMDELTNNSDYCIRVTDLSGNKIYGNDSNQNICGFIGSSDNEIISQVVTMYKEALQNNGEILYVANTSNRFEGKGLLNDIPMQGKEPFASKLEEITSFDYLIYGKITNSEEHDYFVLVNSRITVVNEIAETLRSQLMIISTIVLVLALFVAFFIASRISKPIIETNETAKRLAEGNFDVPFNSSGYREIEELNKTLSYAEKELGKAENLRNELIANISHDLRTPLTMISGYAEVMRDLPGENTPENVQVIIDECHRLNVLVNDILDLSKLQAKAQKLEEHEFNLTQVIKAIIERFSILLKNDNYSIEFEYEDEINVWADEVKLNQVVYNLLANAIHYTGEDKKVVVRQIIKEKNVRIEVSDSGEGISEEDLPYVWERYYKLDKVHKRPQVGTGLGLSIVKGVLEMHKANYGVTSKLNEGTTFFFELNRK